MPTNNPDLATLLAAVEQAWNSTTGHPGTWADVAEEIEAMLAALRAARDSGYAVALVSRDAAERAVAKTGLAWWRSGYDDPQKGEEFDAACATLAKLEAK